MCIYYGEGNHLTYTKHEHIFSAAVGGRAKLPKGYVSDAANELFSKYEVQAFRNSLLTGERLLSGPGKRGNLNRKPRSPLNIIRYEDGNWGLGFIDDGIEHLAPHIYLHGGIARMGYHRELGTAHRHILLDTLARNRNPYRQLIEPNMPKDALLIGVHEGSIFIGTKEKKRDAQIDKVLSHIIDTFRRDDPDIQYSQKPGSHLRILIENEDVARVYGKTAFNVLASLKGQNYVKHPSFDLFRNWLMGTADLKNWPQVPQPHQAPIPIPDQAHWCTIMRAGEDLLAVVSYYNLYSRGFILGKDPDRSISNPIGLICDWKNQREYTLIDWIAHMCTDTNDI